MNFDHLKAMSAEQLVVLAAQSGVKFHPRAKTETIVKQARENPDAFIKRILEAVQTPAVKPTEFVDPRLAASKAPVFNTEAEVEAALAAIKQRVPEFRTIYDANDRTVTFNCKGAEECHNLSVPLHWLVKRAQLIMRGRLVPMGLNEHFESLNSSTGKNSYTNTVLAG